MRKARAALALLLAFVVPVRAETTADPLWYLLSTTVLAPDARAVTAEGEGPADAKGLAALQADLLVLADGLESFRDEAQIKETLVRLEPPTRGGNEAKIRRLHICRWSEVRHCEVQ